MNGIGGVGIGRDSTFNDWLATSRENTGDTTASSSTSQAVEGEAQVPGLAVRLRGGYIYIPTHTRHASSVVSPFSLIGIAQNW